MMSINPLPQDTNIFEQLIENNFDSSWVISLRENLKVEYINKFATEELLGYPQEKFFEQSDFWLTIIHPDDRDKAIAAHNECYDKGVCEVKYRIFHKNGKMKWLLNRLKLIRDKEGLPYRILGSSMDITEATLYEQKLKANEELFQSLANYAPVGIFKCDISGDCTYVNKEWSEIVGTPSEEALGSGWRINIALEDHDRVANEWQMATTEMRSFTSEFRFLNPVKGTRIVCARSAPVIGPDGRMLGFVGTVEDITDRRQAALTLDIQRQKLVTSAKMSSLGEMASGIAHEINNPLMIITGTCTKLLRALDENRVDECASEVSRIESTAFRISKIIKGLKSFSRNAESDVKEMVTINRLIEDTLELCGQRFENENIQIIKNMNGLGEREVNVRPTQLVQVLLNLLSNSYDAVEKLTEKWIHIDLERTLHGVVIKVCDSGPGIPDHMIEKIMEPFFTTKEVGKGTGLGLSISRGIMENNGGRLVYVKDKHTCFALEFMNAV